jgi:hypothetical protein
VNSRKVYCLEQQTFAPELVPVLRSLDDETHYDAPDYCHATINFIKSAAAESSTLHVKSKVSLSSKNTNSRTLDDLNSHDNSPSYFNTKQILL